MNAARRVDGWRRWVWTGILAMAGVLAGAGDGRAAGLLIADGGLGGQMEIVDHEVKVTVNNGVAVTRVTQVFRNKENRTVEALYTFPVPRGASVANFSMWINGKEMVGEVVEKERAREIYNSYKAQRRDPGLLEQADYRTFEMRIFPVMPNAEQKVEVTYYQELEIDHDAFRYVYPLATTTRPGSDSQVSGTFSLWVDVRSAVPIASVGSPSHASELVVAKHSPEYVQASLERKGGSLAKDVVVDLQAVRPKTGLDLVTSKAADGDGWFLLTLTAGEDLGKLDVGMDYVFVLDISGSMGDDGKLGISKESVAAFVRALDADDRFEVITFNVQPNPLFGELKAADAPAVERVASFLGSTAAGGGTVLNPAMTIAYKYSRPDRPLNVVILSDGMTEQRERQELLQLIQARPGNARVFCIGVGNDVNRPLLEQLAEDSGGLAAFLSRSDDFDRQAKAFQRKLARPAAARLKIDIKGVQVYDLEPAVLPDLYHGCPVRLYGRYKGDGTARVDVSADVRGLAFKTGGDVTFPARDTANPEIERMWAWKRIDGLLKAADRTGSRDSVKDQVVALGESYSIVTEYTSFLVLENDAEFQRWKIERRNVARTGRDRQAQQQRQAELETLRQKAVADIGPQAAERKTEAVPPAQAQVPQAQPSAPAPGPAVRAPSTSTGRGVDLNFGSAPVGPLLLIASLLMGRLLKRKAA